MPSLSCEMRVDMLVPHLTSNPVPPFAHLGAVPCPGQQSCHEATGAYSSAWQSLGWRGVS
eukprot:6263983-Amphidinium_carterae.1